MDLHSLIKQEYHRVDDELLDQVAYELKGDLVDWLSRYMTFTCSNKDKMGMFNFYSPQMLQDICIQHNLDGDKVIEAMQMIQEHSEELDIAIMDFMKVVGQ